MISIALVVLICCSCAGLVAVSRRLRRAHRLLAASEAESRTVQLGVTEAIQIFGTDGVLVSRNPAANHIFEMGGDDLNRAALVGKWEFLDEHRSPLSREQRPLGIAMRTGVTAERVVVGIRRRDDEAVKWLSMSTFPIRGPRAEVSGYVSCAWDITEQTQTNRELDVLSRASEQLSSSLVTDEVVGALTHAAAELCSAPGERRRRAVLFTIEGRMLRMHGSDDPESPAGIETVTLPLAEHPYIQRVIATRQPVLATVDHATLGATVADTMRRTGIENCAWLPMTENDEVFAVLSVSGRQDALVTSLQLQRLRTLATMGELALRNARAHERVAELARTDPLTGVGNRRALGDRLAQMPRTRFALVAIDVDNLKVINDAHGHHAGDELLARLAPALAAELRPSDMLARTGGDEFVALLVDCDAPGAVELGKRLQRAAERVYFAWGRPSISVGTAAGDPGDAPADVARAADRDLYSAKQETKERAGGRLSAAGPARALPL